MEKIHFEQAKLWLEAAKYTANATTKQRQNIEALSSAKVILKICKEKQKSL